jgi:hypothetical protein
MRTVRKLRWYLLGAAAAALLLVTTNALAGSGVGGIFNLGELNTVNAQTSLSGNAGGSPQLRVENSATVQNAFGVLGRITAGAPAGQTAGVRGINSGTNANGFGVWGFHQGSGIGVFGEAGAGTGVLGRHTGTAGTAPGVQGETNSSAADAVGVLGRANSPSSNSSSAGIKGVNADHGAGVIGESAIGSGVVGRHTTATATQGSAGVLGTGFGPAEGVRGVATSNGTGIHGCSPDCREFFAGFKIGGLFEASSSSDLGGIGVIAAGGALVPVSAIGSAEDAGTGVFAFGDSVGVLGTSAAGGLAGKFEGNLHTTGRVTKAYTSGTSSQAVPIAYGTVRSDGVLLSGTPNVSSSYDSVNDRYLVTIANETYTTAAYITSVTPTTAAQPRFATTTSATGKLSIRVFDHNGNLQPTQFSFVIYKP